MDTLLEKSLKFTQAGYQKTLSEFDEMKEFATKDKDPTSFQGLDGIYSVVSHRNVRYQKAHYNKKTKALNITTFGGLEYLEIHNDEIKTLITTAKHVDLSHCPNLTSFVNHDGTTPGKILCPNKEMDYMRVHETYIVDINGSKVKTMNVGTEPPFFLLMQNNAEVKKFETEWFGESVIQSDFPIQGDRLLAFNYKYLTLNKGDMSLNSETGHYENRKDMFDGFRNHVLQDETLSDAEKIIANNFFKKFKFSN